LAAGPASTTTIPPSDDLASSNTEKLTSTRPDTRAPEGERADEESSNAYRRGGCAHDRIGGAGPGHHERPAGWRCASIFGLVTDFEFVCSGALISPTVFVTAAHCFETPGQEVSVTVDPQGFSEDADLVTGHWFPNPEFCSACSPGLVGFDTHDVAVVVLDEPIAVSRHAQLPTTDQVEGLPIKQRLTLVG
jgi:hypothetical protein